MAQEERVQFINDGAVRREGPVVYWMQSSVRSRWNHALEYAIHLANHRRQPLFVLAIVTPTYPGANRRHYHFFIEGLAATAERLKSRGITLSLWLGDPEDAARGLRGLASTIVTDRGYLRHLRAWRRNLAENADCPVVQVESNIVVPVELASNKEEYSAATIRRKIHAHWDRFLVPLEPLSVCCPADDAAALEPQDGAFRSIPVDDLSDPNRFIDTYISADASVPPSTVFSGGEVEAERHLNTFLESKLPRYDELRNVPDKNWLSGMSPYLHFGHVSPVEIAVRAIDYAESHLPESDRGGVETLLEELIVRRELAINYTEYNDEYDRYAALPDWAHKTLAEHATDPRPYEYSFKQLEDAETDDPYWNACQREMVVTGKMHGYMRMYWGKKILEWTVDPEEAFERAVALNDRYELDGRDPNGYAGVAWVFGKHDRPWVERSIFGKVRYMNANGLKRKFKEIHRYVDRWTR